jgi:hypothetical protein
MVEELSVLIESGDEDLYLRPDLGLARLIALSTPGVGNTDNPARAAGVAIRHLRTLSRRRNLLAKAFRLMRLRSRRTKTARALLRRTSGAY